MNEAKDRVNGIEKLGAFPFRSTIKKNIFFGEKTKKVTYKIRKWEFIG